MVIAYEKEGRVWEAGECIPIIMIREYWKTEKVMKVGESDEITLTYWGEGPGRYDGNLQRQGGYMGLGISRFGGGISLLSIDLVNNI